MYANAADTISNELVVTPLGQGRFSVGAGSCDAFDDACYIVALRQDGSASCSCKVVPITGTCEHASAVSRFVMGMERSQRVEVPDPLDATQMNLEALGQYQMELNQAQKSVTDDLIDATNRCNEARRDMDVAKLKLAHIKSASITAASIAKALRP